jgi:hypothetical protein
MDFFHTIFPVDKYTHYSLTNFIFEYSDNYDILPQLSHNFEDFTSVCGSQPSKCVEATLLAKILKIAEQRTFDWIIEKNTQDILDNSDKYIVAALNSKYSEQMINIVLRATPLNTHALQEISHIHDAVLASGDTAAITLLHKHGFKFIYSMSSAKTINAKSLALLLRLTSYDTFQLVPSDRYIFDLVVQNPDVDCIACLLGYITDSNFTRLLRSVPDYKIKYLFDLWYRRGGDCMKDTIDVLDLEIVKKCIVNDPKSGDYLFNRLDKACSKPELLPILINLELQKNPDIKEDIVAFLRCKVKYELLYHAKYFTTVIYELEKFGKVLSLVPDTEPRFHISGEIDVNSDKIDIAIGQMHSVPSHDLNYL